VSCRHARGLLNLIVVVAAPNYSVGVVIGVVDVVDNVGDVVNADEVGGAGISAVVMDTTV
jgi:hypothetical protein